ncbi:hypothetical protein FACS189468_2410 [Spirochaetia bacterium]|nr:hypothetical protein FACS189468_2410 [Spirochaetia bacterium]
MNFKKGILFSAFMGLWIVVFGQSNDDFTIVQNRIGTVTITGYGGTENNVIIPGEINGTTVTVIGSRVFQNKALTGVTIPGNITSIGFQAFSNNQLTAVQLPPGLTSIEYEAFADNQLTDLIIPDSVTSIGLRAFARNQLTRVAVSQGVTYIGKDAFAGSQLTSITMGANKNIFTSQGFELSFVNYYGSTGKKAGTYVKNDRVWSRQEESLGEAAREAPASQDLP